MQSHLRCVLFVFFIYERDIQRNNGNGEIHKSSIRDWKDGQLRISGVVISGEITLETRVFKRHDVTRSREYPTYYRVLSKSVIVIYGRRVANSYGFWEVQTTGNSDQR